MTSVHNKVSDKTEVGLTSRYNLQTSNVSLGLVGKYTLDDGAVLKVRNVVIKRLRFFFVCYILTAL